MKHLYLISVFLVAFVLRLLVIVLFPLSWPVRAALRLATWWDKKMILRIAEKLGTYDPHSVRPMSRPTVLHSKETI